jgi:hypothetical protein
VARWTDTTAYANLPSPAEDDLLPIADVSQAEGSRQRTITWGQLSALAAAGATVHAVDPTITDDETEGYRVGSVWVNLDSGNEAAFVCSDASEGAASWAAWPGGGAEVLSDLTDVDTSGVSDGDRLTYDSGTSTWVPAPPIVGDGDVVGPASAADERIAVFDGTSGKLIKDGGVTIATARTQSFVIACSDETTALTTGNGKVTFRMPYAFTLTAVRASVTTAPTGSVLTVDINEAGSSILSTKLTIDATEKTSTTAATAAVMSDTSLADDAEITVDIDGVGSTVAGAGLKVTLIGRPT